MMNLIKIIWLEVQTWLGKMNWWTGHSWVVWGHASCCRFVLAPPALTMALAAVIVAPATVMWHLLCGTVIMTPAAVVAPAVVIVAPVVVIMAPATVIMAPAALIWHLLLLLWHLLLLSWHLWLFLYGTCCCYHGTCCWYHMAPAVIMAVLLLFLSCSSLPHFLM